MENRIEEFRKKRGLSQKELGCIVETSQQQIQRYEKGNQSIPLPLAEKISSALKARLPELFPDLRKVESLKLKREKNQELVDHKRKIDHQELEMAYHWCLRLQIRGFEKAFIFFVEKTEADRISSIFRFPDARNFLCFDTCDGDTIAINISEVDSLNVLWDFGHLERPKSSMEDFSEEEIERMMEHNTEKFSDLNRISVYTKGNLKPFYFDELYGDGNHSTYVIASLEDSCISEIKTLDFIDEDGEFMFINLDRVVILKFPAEFLKYEGESEIERDSKNLS